MKSIWTIEMYYRTYHTTDLYAIIAFKKLFEIENDEKPDGTSSVDIPLMAI